MRILITGAAGNLGGFLARRLADSVGDDQPITLQHFLDLMADHWGFRRPVRLPAWTFYAAAAAVEADATVLQPL